MFLCVCVCVSLSRAHARAHALSLTHFIYIIMDINRVRFSSIYNTRPSSTCRHHHHRAVRCGLEGLAGQTQCGPFSSSSSCRSFLHHHHHLHLHPSPPLLYRHVRPVEAATGQQHVTDESLYGSFTYQAHEEQLLNDRRGHCTQGGQA